MTTNLTRDSYDAVASDYVEQQVNQLYPDSLEFHLLNHFIQLIDTQKTVGDLGCGPGQVAAFLHEQGIPVIGVDLSPVMLEQAHKLHPEITFQQADMYSLPFSDNQLSAATAFYSLIHVPRTDMIQVLDELYRVIEYKGYLLLTFYLGKTENHRKEWLGNKVSLDFYLFTLAEMKGYLREAGFRPQITVEHSRTHKLEAPFGLILAQKIRKALNETE